MLLLTRLSASEPDLALVVRTVLVLSKTLATPKLGVLPSDEYGE